MAEPKYMIGVPIYVGEYTSSTSRGDIVPNTNTWKNIGQFLIVATLDKYGELTPAFGLEERGAAKLSEIIGGGLRVTPLAGVPSIPSSGGGGKETPPYEADPTVGR